MPVLYGFSSHVVPVPGTTRTMRMSPATGSSIKPETWHPPTDLADFLAAGEPPVYIGFGSMGFGQHGR